MGRDTKTYLKTKNILILIGFLPLLIFICPSGNSWLLNPEHYLKQWLLHFLTEAVFIIIIFSYKSLLDRKYKNAIVLSLFGLINFSFAYYFSLFGNFDRAFIPFFHPIALSIPISFLFEKEYKKAIIGYLIGYCLSFFPLIGSLLPIIFINLWLSTDLSDVRGSRFSRFLVRFFIYYILSFSLFVLTTGLTLPKTTLSSISFSKIQEIINAVLLVLLMYVLLNKYMEHYISVHRGEKFKLLSFIPVIWIFPLFEILFKKNEKSYDY